MWMNYDDFTRTKRTNAISQVNGIASEYVRRLDDEPSKKLYDGRTRLQAFMAHTVFYAMPLTHHYDSKTWRKKLQPCKVIVLAVVFQ